VPTGSFDLNGLPALLAGNALQTGVFLYDPTSGSDNGPMTFLPNIQWLRIDYKEGPNPPVAEFKYLQDDTLWINLGWPSQFEQLWPIDVPPSPYVVKSDDRVVILAQNPDGSTAVMFDGFAQIPVLATSPTSQNVTFAAVGVAVRCFDEPIKGRVQRNSDTASINLTDGSADVPTDLPTRFNPSDTAVADGNKGGYIPNCSPMGKDTVNISTGNYPVFIDPGIERSPDIREYWTIAGAVKYLMATNNEAETYVNNPHFTTLNALLQADYPPDNGEFFDPTADSSSDIEIRDYDCTNKPWPEAVAELLSYGGFVMRFDTTMAGDGETPQTDLKFYRRDAANRTAPKLLYLAPAGDPIDPSTSNTTGLHLARDCNAIANAWLVETSQERWECSFLLAPLYQPSPGDADAAGMVRNAFWKSSWTSSTTALVRRKYRWYGVDELGDGYWNETGAWTTADPFDFSPIFPPNNDGTPAYVNRYRPAQHSLISLDSLGHPLKAELAISIGQDIEVPDFWKGSGDGVTWQTIPSGWTLLKDRLGIEVTEENPDMWNIGQAGGVCPGGILHGILWWANPPDDVGGTATNGYAPILRLTVVVEDDLQMGIAAQQRKASPTKFARWRVADARDHFQKNSVMKDSLYYTQDGGNGTDPYIVRDDTDPANTHAKQLRSAKEMPPLAGSVTLPFITPYYEVGDRLQQITGRDANLTTNVGLDQGESPEYPWVVGVSWTNDADRQQTVLQLSDHRAEPRNP